MPVWRETGWNGPVTGWCDRLDGGVRRLQHGGIGFRVVRDRSLNRLLFTAVLQQSVALSHRDEPRLECVQSDVADEQ